ncbi:predicted protein [Phaeodactylum tricornutum CCAP 1055/1]|jgi:hypothetical protein|uniref:Transmembrane protein n=1 Tax=Phaeodactylum tricornutum (strain CCAP 1055/1) TaxID=556484 RepID=B7G233_PHATC|nr:predicted protein [Phaeodactylum tricornutum CCAP 1055/1]EEC47064.1 predicted protein [Phaeodactylum tricornutum CCAP 1055/1]|eukprot:XP_002181141.1 predicted protein [Phaeodactylum tricornutum CCAP 1055/1]
MSDNNNTNHRCEPKNDHGESVASVASIYQLNGQRVRHTRINSTKYKDTFDDSRMVVVRYFLDRPGYDLHNATARLWFHPPTICSPEDVRYFLKNQGVSLEGLLIEIYLDTFESFMVLESCAANCVEWSFEGTSYQDPGILNIRLTDLIDATMENVSSTTRLVHPTKYGATKEQANTSPVGLFSFSMVQAMQTMQVMSKLIPDSVAESWTLTNGPYMFFLGGVVQFVVGIFQVLRGNIYGATAFLAFGGFLMADGAGIILRNHFSDAGSRAVELIGVPDPWGNFFRHAYICAFCCVLLKQTLVMNKLTTGLIAVVCTKLAASSFTGWSETFEWMEIALGWIVSVFAFYVFTVEVTNEVYHREVFPMYKWSERHSPEELFGATGRIGTLTSKATKLRQANYPTPLNIRWANTMHGSQQLQDN